MQWVGISDDITQQENTVYLSVALVTRGPKDFTQKIVEIVHHIHDQTIVINKLESN